MSASNDELLEQVRETAQGYTVYGELGRRADDDVWFLARQNGSAGLVALRLKRDRVDEHGEPVFSLEVARELSSDVALGEGDCWKCRSKLRSFARFCSRCGADQTAGTEVPASESARAELFEAVKLAAGDGYDVIGEMSWSGGGGAIYFATEKASGALVRLRVRQGESGLELGETEVGFSFGGHLTAAYVTEAAAPGLQPVIRVSPGSRAAGPPGLVGPPAGRPPGPDPAVASPARPGWSGRERLLLIGVIVLGVLALALVLLVLSR